MFSFAAHHSSDEVQPYLRRICDLTTPNLVAPLDDFRSENRYNRAIPTLLCPWEGDRPLKDEAGFVMTKDFSEQAVGLILHQPFHADRVVLGYNLPDDAEGWPWFFLGELRRCEPVGGGFWELGVELTEFANVNYRRQLGVLLPLTELLIPHPVG